MKRLIIICEGKSEVQFIKNVLSNSILNISLEPRTIETGKNQSGGKAKGGSLNYDRVKNYILNTLKECDSCKDCFVTTFFDYYGLPNNFPYFNQIDHTNCIYRNIELLEKELYNDISMKYGSLQNNKFVPYIQPHEFESLLFCDIQKALENEGNQDADSKILQSMLADFDNNPEKINNSFETAPSKRIIKHFPSYQKTLHGYTGLSKIGLEEIAKKCKHFNEWIEKIKTL